jgi:hypothetical protein
MHPIYIAAIIPTLLGLGIIGGLLYWRASKELRKLLALIVLLELPICAMAFYFIRQPLDGLLQRAISPFSDGYRLIATWYAPLTEEPAKLWVLLIPFIFRRVKRSNFVFFALAIGLGFGIGELWMLAYEFSKVPAFASLTWYAFSGFMQERLLVCFMHGAFTAAALMFFRKKLFLIGFLIALLLHYIGNFPIFLAAVNFAGLSTETWQTIVLIWVQLYFLAMVGFITFLYLKMRESQKEPSRSAPSKGEDLPQPPLP